MQQKTLWSFFFLPVVMLNRKGQKRIFFCHNKKGISIIIELVFIVLMLIRCVASLLSLKQPIDVDTQRQKTRDLFNWKKVVNYLLRLRLSFLGGFMKDRGNVPRKTESVKTCGWSENTGWDFWWRKKEEGKGWVKGSECFYFDDSHALRIMKRESKSDQLMSITSEGDQGRVNS